jgi:pimeloyl-ACP methyl ester carboxylesterase
MRRRDALAGLAATAALPYVAACTSLGGAPSGDTHGMQKWAYSTEGYDRTVHRIDGVETVVYAIGQGEPLVYFHGGGTFHGFEWSRALANDFRVYHPIHPNFGESGDAPFDQMADYVAHYEMLFPALGLDTFNLAGASMGGHMAARYAAANPGDIDKLVLNAAAGLKADNVQITDFSKIPPQQMSAQFVHDPNWILPYWPSDPTPEWQALRDREQRAAFASREDLDATDRAIRQGLKGFDRPTLLLWGEKDRIVPLGFQAEWHKVLPHAELAVIPDGGHLLLDEFPAAVEAVRRFLKA